MASFAGSDDASSRRHPVRRGQCRDIYERGELYRVPGQMRRSAEAVWASTRSMMLSIGTLSLFDPGTQIGRALSISAPAKISWPTICWIQVDPAFAQLAMMMSPRRKPEFAPARGVHVCD